MANKQVVLAFFDDEAAADAAVATLKDWDKASDIGLTSIGVLVLDDKGKVKTHKMGSRSTMKGAGIGLVLAVVAPAVVVAGFLPGAIVGAIHHKGLGLKGEDRDRIGAELAGGKAAVGVLVTDEQATLVSEILADLGGTPETHELADEAVAELDAAVPAVEAEAAVAPATEAAAEA